MAREILLDVTRLVWRTWRGRHPTGIDRVCLAYVEHFRGRALGVVQREGFKLVLTQAQSDRLFNLFLRGGRISKLELAAALARVIFTAKRAPPRSGMPYLNVGHTGLNDPSLSDWILKNQLRAVYLIHDLIPITNPEYCRPGEREKHRQRMEFALKSATGIIANSQATLTELEDFSAEVGLAMPRGIVALISGYERQGDAKPAVLDRPYFVVVGTIEARKNHLLLLEIWQRLVSRLGDSAPLLVIAGQRGWEAEDATTILDRPGKLHGAVFEAGDCDDQGLADLIAGARALLMPSFAEGFGLPITEALSFGTPVIASDLPVFREIAGDIPLYLDPLDSSAWEAEVEAFGADSPERLRQLSRMKDYRAPTWAEHFNMLESWLKTVHRTDGDNSGSVDFQLETTA